MVVKLLDFTTSKMCVYAHAPICYTGSPTITLRFDDSLKGVTELGKASIPMVMFYYTKRYRLKSAMKNST